MLLHIRSQVTSATMSQSSMLLPANEKPVFLNLVFVCVCFGASLHVHVFRFSSFIFLPKHVGSRKNITKKKRKTAKNSDYLITSLLLICTFYFLPHTNSELWELQNSCKNNHPIGCVCDMYGVHACRAEVSISCPWAIA